MRFSGDGANLVLFARKVRRQAAVDAAGIGGRRARLAYGQLLQRHRLDEAGLQVEPLAGDAELRAHAARELQLELVDHQLEPLHLAGAGAPLLLEQLRVVGQLADRFDVLRHESQCATGSARAHRDHSRGAIPYAAN